jgi:uncharacterized SAM-binding protein YcdF (DUF218 family)
VVRWLLILLGLWLAGIVLLFAFVLLVGQQSDAVPSDAIVVLGAGLRRDGEAGDALRRRTLWAAEAYQAGYAPVVICTGGRSTPTSRSEADACRDVLLRAGVPESAIVLEDQSRSTEENALFSQRIFAERGWTTAVLVTDGFHMFRAAQLFNDYGIANTRLPLPRERIRISLMLGGALREVLAWHWYAAKTVLRLPYTDFSL